MAYVEVDTSLPLAINVVDGMFAYQKAIGGYRVIGSGIGDENMGIVLKNIRTAVRILQTGENALARFWRVWPWMFRMANPKVPKFKMVHQFPMLNPPLTEEKGEKSKHIPAFLYSGAIRHEVSQRITGTPWNSMVSLMGPDTSWMMKHDVIRVFDAHGVWSNRTMLNLAKELQTGRRLIIDEDCDEQPFKQTLQYYYQNKPEAVVMMLYALFMPNFLLTKLPNIRTVQMFNIIMCTEILRDYPYSILRVGLPAIHKLYKVPYPASDIMNTELPDVEVPDEILAKPKRMKMPSAAELADLF